MVADSSGDIFLGDAGTQGALRIDSSGAVTAYPTYSTFVGIMPNPLYLTLGSNGHLYLTSTAAITLFDTFQALTPIDTTQW